MISERDLKIFQELCSTLNISKAAQRLGVTQPALTLWIKKVENELQLNLFLRSKKGLTLTKAGRKLELKSNEMISTWENFIHEIKEDEESYKGQFRFGIHTGVALYSLPQIYKSLNKNYPEIELKLIHNLSRNLTEEVVSNKLDLALVMNPIKHPDLVIIPIFKDIMCIWSLENLKEKETLIYNPELIQAQWLLKKLKSKKIEFKKYIETNSFEVAASLANQGIGMAILPEKISKVIGGHKLNPIDSQSLRYIDELCLIYKAGFQKSKSSEALIKTIKSSLLSIK